ncbi:MAG: hypothetical protein Q4C52_11930 [Eubacteriales bacterium]|nr:hypothetical protein [Eubacteriales bacterium]
MKVILKDQRQFEATRCNINLNTLTESEDEKATINIFVEEGDIGEVTVEELGAMLTPDNISEFSLVTSTMTKQVAGKKLLAIGENITDEQYSIDIRIAKA